MNDHGMCQVGMVRSMYCRIIIPQESSYSTMPPGLNYITAALTTYLPTGPVRGRHLGLRL